MPQTSVLIASVGELYEPAAALRCAAAFERQSGSLIREKSLALERMRRFTCIVARTNLDGGKTFRYARRARGAISGIEAADPPPTTRCGDEGECDKSSNHARRIPCCHCSLRRETISFEGEKKRS